MTVRCRYCNKILADRVNYLNGDIKCNRCKTVNTFNVVSNDNPTMNLKYLDKKVKHYV